MNIKQARECDLVFAGLYSICENFSREKIVDMKARYQSSEDYLTSDAKIQGLIDSFFETLENGKAQS